MSKFLKMGTTLWAVNLNDKKLYQLPVGNTADPLNPIPPAASDIIPHDIIGNIIANGDDLGVNTHPLTSDRLLSLIEMA